MLTEKLTPDTLDEDIPEDDAVCCVCGYSDIDGSNVMVMCDSCAVAVHKDCYAITDDDLKKDKWYCLPCSQRLYPKNPDGTINTHRKCIACNHVGGAFSKTLDNRWIHTACAMFNPQMKLTDLGVDIPQKSSDTPTHECEICKTNFGYTVKCAYIECHNYMHPHCMIRTPEDYTIDSFPNPTNRQRTIDCLFCKEHSALAKQRHAEMSCIMYNGAAVACTEAKRAEIRQARRQLKRQEKERERQHQLQELQDLQSDASGPLQTTRSGRATKQIVIADAMLSGDEAVRALRDADTEPEASESNGSDDEKATNSRRRRRRQGDKKDEEDEDAEHMEDDGDAEDKTEAASSAAAAPHSHAPRRQPRTGADTLGDSAHAAAAPVNAPVLATQPVSQVAAQPVVSALPPSQMRVGPVPTVPPNPMTIPMGQPPVYLSQPGYINTSYNYISYNNSGMQRQPAPPIQQSSVQQPHTSV